MYYSTFFGIELGKRALMTQQAALHTTAHNIANANTPGYSRQISNLAATDPFNMPQGNRIEMPGQLGTGVKLDFISRSRNILLETQIQRETSNQANLDSKVEYMNQVEGVINEPSDNAIGEDLNKFWAAWQDLSSNPENLAVRNTVLARGTQLAQALRTADNNFASLQQQADMEYRAQIGKINELGEKIRDLNVEINKSLGVGTAPNDLLDKRDSYLRDMAKLVNYQGTQEENGLYAVTINGHTLVQDNVFIPIDLQNDPANNNYAQAVWSDDATPVTFASGKLQGLVEIRDTNIPSYRTTLDQLTQGIMTSVNAVHAAGYALNSAAPSGENFFSGTGAGDITVNTVLTADSKLLAAATNPSAPGDGSNALALAQLQNALSMNAGTQTIGEFYQALVSQVGIESENIQMRKSNQDTLVASLNTQQESQSGVNLDEEMTDMIKYQDAYQAAARVISTMDNMLNTIINNMGAGR